MRQPDPNPMRLGAPLPAPGPRPPLRPPARPLPARAASQRARAAARWLALAGAGLLAAGAGAGWGAAPAAAGPAGTLPADIQPVGDVNAMQDFPHVAAYMRLSSDSHQLNTDSLVAMLARFNVAVIPSCPATDSLGARLQQLRAINPKIILLAYFPGDFMWDGAHYPDGYLYGDCWRMFQRHDWWAYSTNGTPFNYFGNTFDLTNPAAQDSLAWLIASRVLASGLWDGLFLDDFCDSNWWKEGSQGQYWDLNRDGQPDAEATDDPLWKAGTDSLVAKIRRLVGPHLILVGNGCQGSKTDRMNGWMREDFPRIGNWIQNMFLGWGYMTNEQRFLAPRYNFVYSTSQGPPMLFDPSNISWLRFGLASTLLGDGYFMFDPQSASILVSSLWYDEYDGGAGRTRGYLGQPLGDYYMQVGQLSTPEAFTDCGFESGFTGWQLLNVPGQWVLDSSTRVEGTYSAHALIPTPCLYASQVHLGQIANLTWGTWSVTFWAKASSPRDMLVLAQRTESPYTIIATTPVSLGTTWKQYQVSFTNSIGSVPFNCELEFGPAAGEVWVDDVHLQLGASSAYRRDFQNGTVLVNPSSATVNVTLEKPYQHLAGTQDPAVNDGQVTTQVSLGGSQGAILVTPGGGSDLNPPGTVTDLHVVGQPSAPRPVPARKK
ncbi:MAG TPA: carbohydrate binding domain-containing protein [Candidatus Saccharimonadales bacterium]|nr:carbohydrate binding domain-containing protein [Candidatus Saccharimonadales bacterium]